MRLLLDTHVFVWAVSADRRLKRSARTIIDSAEDVFVSAASIWEIAIKVRIGRIAGDPSELAAAIEGTGFRELPVTARHCVQVATLPMHHSDPFDRLLVAQALVEPLRLVTADATLARYSELVELI